MTRGRFARAFDFAPAEFSASINDVVACRNHRPAIVHFAGHGKDRRLVLVRDRDVLADLVPLDLGQVEILFRSFDPRVRLVVFNCCWSLGTARHPTASGMVDMAVGVEGLIADEDAVRFAEEFYRQLADGESVRRALNLPYCTSGRPTPRCAHNYWPQPMYNRRR